MYIIYLIYINASIQIWVSITCNKKAFLKIVRASTTLTILVTAPRFTHFTLIC